ncbi:hypothetical protein ACKLNR_005951 [Fusarium oxysporum f. sp. zingiberi]
MNAIFNFLSSPLKQPAERPPPSSMPLTASRPSLSPREQRLAKRAADRFSEPAGRSPRSRLSNVSLASTDHDNTAEISVVSRRRETIAMAPPPSVKKRISTSARSSPIHRRKSNGSVSRVASSPAVRSSPRRRESAELGGFSPAFATSPASTPKRGINGVSRTSEEAKSPRRSSRASRVTEPQSNSKAQREKTPEEQPEEAHSEEEEAQVDEERHEFDSITDHRWAENEIELRMQWKDGESSWISEELLHTDNPQALFAYWRSQPDGRPKNPEDDEVYQVFAIRKHRVRKGVPQVLVEWVGYGASENTWEDQDYIESVAPKLVDAYFDQVKGKGKSQTKSKPKSTAKPKAPAKTKAQAKTSARGVTRSSARVSKR